MKKKQIVNKDVCKEWEEIAKNEGVNVSKEFIYGDELYEEVF